RRKNLVRPQLMPYPNAVGARYDSGTYEANMDLAMRNADWDGFAARRRQAKAHGKLLGLGLANYVESSIGAPNERSEITVTPAGRVEVVIGTQPNGQGHETRFAQVVSALLGVPVAAIDLVTGDTDRVSLGGGSHCGRSMRDAATLIVHGQSHGGIGQGVGQAMWEECAIDPASGQPLCGSFMDYGMPRSDNLPSFATEIVEVLSPTNPFGIKAGSDGGCTPALAVV